MEVDITRAEHIRDLTTIEGKINGQLVSVVLDSASNIDFMPQIVADQLGLKGNANVSCNFRGSTGVEEKFSESVDATSGNFFRRNLA